MNAHHDALAAVAANLCAAILYVAAAIWTSVTGEAVWVTVLLVILGLAALVTVGLILRGGERNAHNHRSER